MPARKSVRWGVTGALLLMLLGTLQGCMGDPTGAPVEDNCVLIDGVLYCKD